ANYPDDCSGTVISLHHILNLSNKANRETKCFQLASVVLRSRWYKNQSPKLDVTLEKLIVSSRRPIIFPDRLQVTKKYKNQFLFESLDVTFDDSGPLSVIESTHQNGDGVTEPSLR
nr:hypothetical protein [Tanacetum cinerariifolium]